MFKLLKILINNVFIIYNIIKLYFYYIYLLHFSSIKIFIGIQS